MIPSLIAEREPPVVDAQQVQHGGVQVMYVDRVLGDVVAEVVGFAVGVTGADREALLAILNVERNQQEPESQSVDQDTVARLRSLFTKAQVFDKADKLVEKYRARAEAIADEVLPTELRELLYYLVDTVLDRQPPPEEVNPALVPLQIVA
jgi:hypothetical protein